MGLLTVGCLYAVLSPGIATGKMQEVFPETSSLILKTFVAGNIISSLYELGRIP